MEEIWKPLVLNNIVFENYLVSNKGKVYNKKLNKELKHTYFRDFKVYHISVNKKDYSIVLHRVVAELFVPKDTGSKYVLFKDNNKENCSADNLYWSDYKVSKNENERQEKIREKNKRNVIKRRQRIKNRAVEYKGNSCLICGYNRCIVALEFHHLNPNEKDFAIANMYTKNWEIIKSELDKCVLLCANCHREIESGFIFYDLEKLEKDRKNNIPR